MDATTRVRPTREDELADAIADAARRGAKLAVRGGGSKAGCGAATDAAWLDMTGFAGVVDYDPPELVLTVRAGTPLKEVQALVAERHQMLAFEPLDHGPLYGAPVGAATIGGVVAAGVAGSQRLSSGAPRDHLLGFRAVSGRGEAFVAGAKVVKNVTGYDLPKLAAGRWGRLVAMTELTLKVLPRPRVRTTLVLGGLAPVPAVRAMAAAMGSPAEVAAAAYLPASASGGPSRTALRLQGFGPSVAARAALLETLLADFGRLHPLGDREAESLWQELRDLRGLGPDGPLWRICVPPSAGPDVARAVEALGGRWLFDWAGGLVWAACDGDPDSIRAAAARGGGHATLVRSPEPMRAAVPALHPPLPGVAALEERVRRAFDPAGVFETGRF